MRFDKTTEKSLQTVAFRVLDFSFVFILFHQSCGCIHAFNIIFLLLTHNVSQIYYFRRWLLYGRVYECCVRASLLFTFLSLKNEMTIANMLFYRYVPRFTLFIYNCTELENLAVSPIIPLNGPTYHVTRINCYIYVLNV